jgi:hypothetical protein
MNYVFWGLGRLDLNFGRYMALKKLFLFLELNESLEVHSWFFINWLEILTSQNKGIILNLLLKIRQNNTKSMICPQKITRIPSKLLKEISSQSLNMPTAGLQQLFSGESRIGISFTSCNNCQHFRAYRQILES